MLLFFDIEKGKKKSGSHKAGNPRSFGSQVYNNRKIRLQADFSI